MISLKEKFNIAIVVQNLFTKIGGLELQALKLIYYLSKYFNIYVYTSSKHKNSIFYRNDFSWANILKIRKSLLKNHINCVIALFSWKGIELWYSALQGTQISLFYSEHSDPDLIEKRMDKNIRERIIYYSRLVRVQLKEYLTHKNMIVIPNVVVKHYNVYDVDSRYILFVGDIFDENKNFTTLLNAFQKLKSDYILLVCGKNKVQSTDNIKYLGIQDLNKIYPKCSIVCVPSLYEGMSNTLLEAMSFNIPTIVNANCRGTNSISQGLTFSSENDLIEKLKLLMQTPSLRQHISQSYDLGLYSPSLVFPIWKHSIMLCVR